MALRIFVAVGVFNWERINWEPALIDMGHDVYWYDWRAKGYDQYSSDWPVKKHEMQADLLTTFLDEHKEDPFDMIFSYLSDPVCDAELIDQLKRYCPIVNFSGNNIASFERGQLETAPHYTLNWCTERAAIPKFRAIGAEVIQMTLAVNEKLYKPMQAKQIYDISFCGTMNGYRPHIVMWLGQQGLSYSLTGNLSFNAMHEHWSKTRVNLGFRGLNNSAFNDTSQKEMRMRDFEVSATRNFYLCEDYEELADYYDIGNEIDTFTSQDELIDKVKYYLAHDEIRLRMADAARKRVLSEHTWKHRFTQLFTELGLHG